MALDQPDRRGQVGGGHRVVGLPAAAEWCAAVEITQDRGQVLVIRVGKLLLQRLYPAAPRPLAHLYIVNAGISAVKARECVVLRPLAERPRPGSSIVV